MGDNRKRAKRRRTCLLREVIGTDLLSWKERFIQGQTSGLYNLTNEQAYFKIHGDIANMSVPDFERKLQTEIDRNFRVLYNNAISPADGHIIQGHSIIYLVSPYNGFIQVCNVGKNSDNFIPAESVGKVVTYKGQDHRMYGIDDEEPLLYRGWVGAFEACKLAYEAWENEGISPAMCMSENEITLLSEATKIVGFKDKLEAAKEIMDEVLSMPEPILENKSEVKEEIKPEEVNSNVI